MKIKVTPEMRIRLMMAEHIVINIDDCLPDGWQLVPVEPTRAMREAFHNAHEEWESGLKWGLDCPDHQWNAMLAVAPKALLTADLVQEGGAA